MNEQRKGHTPGPWFQGGRVRVYDYASGSEIANTGGSNVLEAEEMEANARLIAAAPDLLEACHLAYNMWNCLSETQKHDVFDETASAIIRSIAKAEGWGVIVKDKGE